ncbi:hypothetical protein VFPFJ_08729 [Purpureocillium lilacinum]|uniref:Uncharacterized protein n=1 Tax=Purpureocillium lilacinum TaxID=33203 RepID=A0A179GAH7_PURLI|nr:hypothetical protein VFPFJ_08729 [Purpureocillium lilacinum]OAQ74817.1 hypothetical protein VFPBJ_10112 [Purpureocillium lilacinum]OAQ82926.1 hypothetical protein VFPFJ_08729 [Purpureocillium lilacinum]
MPSRRRVQISKVTAVSRPACLCRAAATCRDTQTHLHPPTHFTWPPNVLANEFNLSFALAVTPNADDASSRVLSCRAPRPSPQPAGHLGQPGSARMAA